MPTQLNILIIGSGIAGPALACNLCKLGHRITVLERFPSLRATGLQIDLRGHGIQVIKRMGLEEAFRARSVGEQGLEIVDKRGKRWGYFGANRTGKGLQSFTTDWEIMRGDFVGLFYETTKDRVSYVFGTSVTSLKETAEGVEVLFENGKEEIFDLVVGADGQGSRTRRMMLGTEKEKENELKEECFWPLGVSMAYFTAQRKAKEGEEYIATQYVATNGRAVLTRRHRDDQMQVYLSAQSALRHLKSAKKGDVVQEKEALKEIFKGAGWRTEQVLEEMQRSDDFYLERVGLIKLKSWSNGRVVLVGDAAYCPSAFTGMGTTSGLVGAYVLAGEIARHCTRSERAGMPEDAIKESLPATLKAYEESFRPFMDQVQKGLTEEGNPWKKFPSSQWGITILLILVSIASFLKVDLFKYVLREDVKGWDLPEYEELIQK